jgi:hypothetical protein
MNKANLLKPRKILLYSTFAAMEIRLYDPFENVNLEPHTCFLTGEDLPENEATTTVFPEWILDRYQLREKKFTLMDQVTSLPYADLKIPFSRQVIDNALLPLEKEIQAAFTTGYDAVIRLPEIKLFQWMSKLMMGVLFYDLQSEKKKAARRNKEFVLSPHLQKRFKKWHVMWQSLVVPMQFEGTTPWSISIVKVNYSKDVFNYRDEPVNMNFSLGMNNFGIVACLGDNGVVAQKNSDLLQKITDKNLHPIQFEELCARYIYTNYLIQQPAPFEINVTDEKAVINCRPMEDTSQRPLFAPWDENMFAQVLADYWKPWGYTKNDIHTFPDAPMSFLENDYDYSFIQPDSISLPR